MAESDEIHPLLRNIPPLPADDPDGDKALIAMLDRREAERQAKRFPQPLGAVDPPPTYSIRMRECVGGPNDGESHQCGPAPYIDIGTSCRVHRYEIVGDELQPVCEVGRDGVPLRREDRLRLGYEGREGDD